MAFAFNHFVATALWFGALVAVVATLFFFFRNLPHRRAIDKALAGSGQIIPEKRIDWYDAGDLAEFVAAARVVNTDDGRTALERYERPTLKWNDTCFAAALGLLVVLVNLVIVPLMPLQPWGGWAALFCALMGLIYGAADIGEDLALARVFAGGVDISPRTAAVATIMTRVKFASFYFAMPAMLGLVMARLQDAAPALFQGGLKLAPLVVLLAGAFYPTFARVLWATRVSAVSALAGYLLFLFVIQAQDLFADTTFGDRPLFHVAFWGSVFVAAALVWALPVHYAARKALEGPTRAFYVPAATPRALIRWTPRVLGMIPIVSIMIGVFSAANETRYAMRLDGLLDLQFVLLFFAAWTTLGLYLIVVIQRRSIVDALLGGSGSLAAKRVERVSVIITTIAFLALVLFPLTSSQYIARAAMIPFLLGGAVLSLAAIGRLADQIRKPLIAFVFVALAILTAANSRFNDLRSVAASDFPATATGRQLSLNEAVARWRAANHCAAPSGDPFDAAKRENCPPVLIIASDGGASRAAYFTAVVVGHLLDGLSQAGGTTCGDPQDPARCIFAMSGVSGGSLGLAAVKAALLDADGGAPCKALSSSDADHARWETCLPRLVAGDYLSPVFVGVGFRDFFAPPFHPFDDPNAWGDRAALLEQSWERHFLKNSTASAGDVCRSDQPTGLCRPLAQARADGRWTPLLLLNGTSVQTGRRIIASELAPLWTKPVNGKDAPQALHQWAYDLFDIMAASCGAVADASLPCASVAAPGAPPVRTVRLSTAALVSARFPIISPAGVIRMQDAGAVHGDSVVDGGYFENSGLTTALDVAAGLNAFHLTPIVLSISNDPVGEVTGRQGVAAMRLPVDRMGADSIWVRAVSTLYAPFAALFATRGGHADEEGAVLVQRLQQWDVPEEASGPVVDRYAPFFPIRVYAKGDDFVMRELSMSWWLSPVVRRALERQVGLADNQSQFCLLSKRLSNVGMPTLASLANAPQGDGFLCAGTRQAGN